MIDKLQPQKRNFFCHREQQLVPESLPATGLPHHSKPFSVRLPGPARPVCRERPVHLFLPWRPGRGGSSLDEWPGERGDCAGGGGGDTAPDCPKVGAWRRHAGARRLRRFNRARPSRVNLFATPAFATLKRPEGRAPRQCRGGPAPGADRKVGLCRTGRPDLLRTGNI